MNTYSNLNPLNLYGIYELDQGGEIVYCGNHSNDGYFSRNTDLIGNNFFDIAGFENVEDFRQRVKYFFQNSEPTDDFNFDCRFSEKVSNVKVRLMRVTERESEGVLKMVIVDIRKV
jgi:hypothetical protein